MKIIFMGTPDFAVPCLQNLIDSKHEVVAVFSQPDRPVGRKQILTAPPVKALAVENNIPVYQPLSLKDSEVIKLIKDMSADLIVVVAYGKILPPDILNAATYGCINVHASLLPKYRGAAPIQWAVLNGETITGVSIMQMNEGLDTGDILLMKETEIGENETSQELFDRLSFIGAGSLLECIENIEQNKINPIKQPQSDFSYAEKITKSLSPIDWAKSAQSVHNQVRGLQTWPCAQTVFNGKILKIHKTRLSDKIGNKSGLVVDNIGVISVCCGDGKCVDILELQAEGKKKMDSKSFLAGNNIKIGSFLG
ncbi:MAG: methionyl-tRNA formyltransferase [Clostridiales bacterium]|nr:methionyl-tRNA formyltransferase [Clostridiales bacterium]